MRKKRANHVFTANSGLVLREVALFAHQVITALKELWRKLTHALLVLTMICKDSGIALFAPQEISALKSPPSQLSAPLVNSMHITVWIDVCLAQLAIDAVWKV